VDLLECDLIEDVGYGLAGNAGNASEIVGAAEGAVFDDALGVDRGGRGL